MLTPEMVPVLVSTGASARVDEEVPQRFKVGDRVRALNLNPMGHTRLPRYIRGRVGVVDRHHGVFVYPDAAAHGSEQPQNVYSVRFEANELWGDAAPGKDALYIDLWDNYIEPA
ncbi:MAG: nitrile hydratase subunit beta [Kiloniellales bacterium]